MNGLSGLRTVLTTVSSFATMTMAALITKWSSESILLFAVGCHSARFGAMWLILLHFEAKINYVLFASSDFSAEEKSTRSHYGTEGGRGSDSCR